MTSVNRPICYHICHFAPDRLGQLLGQRRSSHGGYPLQATPGYRLKHLPERQALLSRLLSSLRLWQLSCPAGRMLTVITACLFRLTPSLSGAFLTILYRGGEPEQRKRSVAAPSWSLGPLTIGPLRL